MKVVLVIIILCCLASVLSATHLIRVFNCHNILTPYKFAYSLQQKLVDEQILQQSTRSPSAANDEMVGSILLMQHPNVYTLGSAADDKSGPFSQYDRDGERLNFEVVRTDRGGQATFHGPGQLVVYPIMDLNYFERDINIYLRKLEQVIISALHNHEMEGVRRAGLTGVWMEDKKVCSIGIKIKRWVTYHGLALNINPDIRYFSNIHPCGMKGNDVGCLATYKSAVDIETITDEIIKQFEFIFDVKGLGKDLSITKPLSPYNMGIPTNLTDEFTS